MRLLLHLLSVALLVPGALLAAAFIVLRRAIATQTLLGIVLELLADFLWLVPWGFLGSCAVVLSIALAGLFARTRWFAGLCVAILGLAAGLAAGCATTPPSVAPTCRHQDAAVEQSIGFCQAVRVGDTLYVSGVAGAGPMEAAVPRVYERLGRILETNGLSFADVVKETVYATDLDAFIKASGARKSFYASWLPAATWVQVQRLYLPSFVLEIEVTAHYPK